MTKVTIPAKSLQRVRQAAKDKREQNVTAFVEKGCLCFTIGKETIRLEGRENGNKQ